MSQAAPDPRIWHPVPCLPQQVKFAIRPSPGLAEHHHRLHDFDRFHGVLNHGVHHCVQHLAASSRFTILHDDGDEDASDVDALMSLMLLMVLLLMMVVAMVLMIVVVMVVVLLMTMMMMIMGEIPKLVRWKTAQPHSC